MLYSHLELGPIETGGHVVVCTREGGREGEGDYCIAQKCEVCTHKHTHIL